MLAIVRVGLWRLNQGTKIGSFDIWKRRETHKERKETQRPHHSKRLGNTQGYQPDYSCLQYIDSVSIWSVKCHSCNLS